MDSIMENIMRFIMFVKHVAIHLVRVNVNKRLPRSIKYFLFTLYFRLNENAIFICTYKIQLQQ